MTDQRLSQVGIAKMAPGPISEPRAIKVSLRRNRRKIVYAVLATLTIGGGGWGVLNNSYKGDISNLEKEKETLAQTAYEDSTAADSFAKLASEEKKRKEEAESAKSNLEGKLSKANQTEAQLRKQLTQSNSGKIDYSQIPGYILGRSVQETSLNSKVGEYGIKIISTNLPRRLESIEEILENQRRFATVGAKYGLTSEEVERLGKGELYLQVEHGVKDDTPYLRRTSNDTSVRQLPKVFRGGK